MCDGEDVEAGKTRTQDKDATTILRTADNERQRGKLTSP